MQGELDALVALATVYGLVALRVVGLFLALPLFAFRAFPLRLRVLPALTVGLALLPGAPRDVPADIGWATVATELGLGLVCGFALRIAMTAVEFAADALSAHAGFGFANLMAPDAALPPTVLGETVGLAAMAVLFVNDVHLVFIQAIGASLGTIPYGGWPLGWDGPALARLLGTAFSVGLVLAVAGFAVYLSLNIALGVMSRIAPQINLMSVGFSLSAPLALLVLALLFGRLGPVVEVLADAAFTFVAAGLGPFR